MSWWLIGSVLIVWFGVHGAYVMVMAAKSALARGELTLYWKIMMTPFSVVGLVLDLAFNWTFGWIMFAESPWGKGLFFSSRVQTHMRESSGWKHSLASFWKRNLNVFDENHIR